MRLQGHKLNNQNQEEDEKEPPSKTERFYEFLVEFFGEILIQLIFTLIITLLGAWFIIGSGMFFLILPFLVIIWILYKKRC